MTPCTGEPVPVGKFLFVVVFLVRYDMAAGEQIAEGAPEELLTFAPLEDGNGLEIVDHIERRHVTIETSRSVTPSESSTDLFEFPVRRAISIDIDGLFLPQQLAMIVRNSLGFMVAEVSKGDLRSFPSGVYTLDPGAHIKIYIKFDSGFEVSVSSEGIRIDLDSMSTVHIGMRSHHKQPAATITTTGSVPDLMQAISYFSSALKTTSCERSYPTLRGHPPVLEIGEELSIPPVLTRPETGIRIEIPENYRSVFVTSPLAYYLGARVTSGEEAKLVTEVGFEYPLSPPGQGLVESVERVLKQVFFLDCVTRTEGFFQVNLHERNVIEDVVDLDFAELYEQPIVEQIETYLQLPYDLVEPHLPTWKLTSHVMPSLGNVEVLPFLVNDLALIKIPDSTTPRPSPAQSLTVDEFTRSSGGRLAEPRASVSPAPTPSTVRIQDDESMEQIWLGEGAPLGASKAMLEAFHNRLQREPSDSDIDITVVCNASEMGQERDIVDEVYGSREELPFDVAVHRELTADEMTEVLIEETDFLHYIGHIDAGGFECVDGRLDVSTIDYTGVDTFFLNACSSYEQGMELIKAGSIAGVVTLQDVINSGAERVGRTLARLLNWGFPLRPAMNIARNESIMGGHYLVIGDGSVDIAQTQTGYQGLCELGSTNHGWRLKFRTYPTRDKGPGSIIVPSLDRCDEYFLISGTTREFYLEEDELIEFLLTEEMPIIFEDELLWCSDLLEDLS